MKHEDIIRSTDDPNPIDRVTILHAYPGWRVRQYRNGMYDATDDKGLSPGFRSFNEVIAHLRAERDCKCPTPARGWWDCLDCPVHGKAASDEGAAEQASEIAAENAWLTHAENQGWDDDPRGW